MLGNSTREALKNAEGMMVWGAGMSCRLLPQNVWPVLR
jgi:hypothetical protein